MHPAIRIQNLSKRYRLGTAPVGHANATEMVTRAVKSAWQKVRQLSGPAATDSDHGFWAVKDVSFEVNRGEVLGVIGRNGAGKSTLLKLLSRITEPTKGRIEVRGRLSSLIEVGAGFHPELTGRENVHLYGCILGMTRAEIASKFDRIVQFAEIGEFLDTPVKRYSSGMFVRLAFSVAAHLEPEILVVDEVLAVGDATFQKRCLDRMTELARQGRTVLFVTHNLQLVPQLCSRAVMLTRGRVEKMGDSGEVTRHYLARLLEDAQLGNLADKPRTGDGRARFVRGSLVDEGGRTVAQFVSGDDLIVRMEVESKVAIPDVALAVVLSNVYGTRIITSWTPEANYRVGLKPGLQAFECRFKNVSVRPGHMLMLQFWIAEGNEAIDSVENALAIDVLGDDRHKHLSTAREQGVVICDYSWSAVAPTTTP
ncbi:MAG TPA: ABC transporter ATP-binding protein [Fimbriiglobus sp.]|jgi:lipopolysaccharide transport system ATP-binding protein